MPDYKSTQKGYFLYLSFDQKKMHGFNEVNGSHLCICMDKNISSKYQRAKVKTLHEVADLPVLSQ